MFLAAAFWHAPLQNMWRVEFEYLAKEPLAVNLNIDTSAQQVPLVKVSHRVVLVQLG